ncbi:MAG: biopolymer transporter ExbD [Acidobacteria bacterium]|nr:biopolymer transporter ExbD [Acidobacteriota bacterium]
MKCAPGLYLHDWTFRGVRTIVLLAFIMMICAAAPRKPAPIRELINVSGRGFHIHGSGRRSPTLLMPKGGAAFSFDWQPVRQGIAQLTPMCTYDRAAYARSSPGREFNRSEQTAYELDLLLAKSPWALVGYSLGGTLIGLHQSKYRADVAGVVLVDTSYEASLQQLRPKVVRIHQVNAKQFHLLFYGEKANLRSDPKLGDEETRGELQARGPHRSSTLGINSMAQLPNIKEAADTSSRLLRQTETGRGSALRLNQGISVKLPVTKNAVPVPNADQEDSIVVTITYDGTLYWGVSPIDPAELAERLKTAFSRRPDKTLYVKVDARTAYASLIKVIDGLRAAGVEALTLLTAQQSPEGPGSVLPPSGLELQVVWYKPGHNRPIPRSR